MPRTVGANLKNHLAQVTTTAAILWEITRIDNTVFRFTEADVPISFGGYTYTPVNSGELSVLEQKTGTTADNFDFNMILSAGSLDRVDLIAGKFDSADVKVYLLNKESVADGAINLVRGKLGEFKVLDDHKGIIEFRSLTDLLSQGVGRTYTHECDADLGDSRCGVALGIYTHVGSVTSVTSNQTFIDTTRTQADGYFNYGLLTWTSGSNDNLTMEVKVWNGVTKTFTLVSPMPYNIQVGDGYSAVIGCNKTKSVCRDTFTNIINFRGFAEIPGQDRILEVAEMNPDAGPHGGGW